MTPKAILIWYKHIVAKYGYLRAARAGSYSPGKMGETLARLERWFCFVYVIQFHYFLAY